MKTYHFISGLPRSGSTLLSALLRQNPRFHAAMTSPVYSIINNLLLAISAKNDYSVFISAQQKERLLRGVFEAYYDDMHDKEIIFDTARGWAGKLPLIANLFPGFRMICCVRNIARIVNSFESVIASNPYDLSGLYGYVPEQNLFDRTDILLRPDGHVGKPLNALTEAINGPYSGRILLVRYEALSEDPLGTLEKIYSFIDEPPFSHDIHNLSYSASEYDTNIGTSGLHEVRKTVNDILRPNTLPVQMIKRLEALNFWQQPGFNQAGIKVV